MDTAPTGLHHETCHELVPQEHHDSLSLGLMDAGRTVLASSAREADFERARRQLVAFCTDDLLPHLDRDELWLTQTSECAEGRLLGLAMRAEARALRAAVEELVSATDACEVIGATRVVHALLSAHIHHQELLSSAAA